MRDAWCFFLKIEKHILNIIKVTCFQNRTKVILKRSHNQNHDFYLLGIFLLLLPPPGGAPLINRTSTYKTLWKPGLANKLKMICKLHENCPTIIWKWVEHVPKTIRTLFENDPKIILKWSQNDPKIIPKWHENDMKLSLIVINLSLICA